MLARALCEDRPGSITTPAPRPARGGGGAREDYRGATVISSDLIRGCRRAGRLAEALVIASETGGVHPPGRPRALDAARQEADRLQILAEQGHADQVSTEVQRLRQQMAEIPERE